MEKKRSRTRSCSAGSTGGESPSVMGVAVVSGIKWVFPVIYLHPMVGDPGRGTEVAAGITFRERAGQEPRPLPVTGQSPFEVKTSGGRLDVRAPLVPAELRRIPRRRRTSHR